MAHLTVNDCFYQIRNGANIKQGDADGGYPITRIETISNDVFNRDRMGYAGITDLTKYESYVLEDGDLLMSHINSVQYLGRTVLYEKQGDEKIIHGMNLLGLKANRSIVKPAFARYAFYSPKFRQQLRRITKKSVNQASFTVADLKKIEIDVPSLEKQAHIVENLDKTKRILALRRQEIEVLDALIKARFVELTTKWNASELPLSDFLDDITYGFTNPMPDSDVGPWKITAKDVVNGHVNFETARKTTQEAYDLLTAKSKPIIGDVLLTKDGTLGRTAIVEDEDLCVNQSVAVLRCNERVMPRFLTLLLQLPEYQTEMTKNSGGGTIKHIYITKVDKMPVKIPDINAQKDIISFVKQVDKSKVAVQKSLDETQLLFNSLMQKYFG